MLNSRFCTLPPVIDPPGLTISPFSVAILNEALACRLIAIAASRSLTITVLPSRFSIIPLYFSSKLTSSLATPMNPFTRQQFSSRWSSILARIADIGKNVALP